MRRERPEAPLITGVGQARQAPPDTSDLAHYMFYAVLLLLLALAGWLYMSTVVRVDSVAVEVYESLGRQEDLRHDVAVLQTELAEKESLERISEEAERLGYTQRTAEQQITVSPGEMSASSPEGQSQESQPQGIRGWLSDILGGGDADEGR